MKTGKPLIINIDNLMPDFINEYTSEEETNFISELVFDWHEWRKDENWQKIFREGEGVDEHGNVRLHENFTIIILAKYESYTKCNELLELIPFSEDWLHLCCKKAELKPKDNKIDVKVPIN